MDWLQGNELDFLRFLETLRFEWLNQFFITITMFGEELIIILVLTFIYWIYSKREGTRLTYAIGLSLLVNAGLKDIFKWERPIREAGINALYTETATGFSFPSGHSQISASWLTGVSLLVKRRWFSILAATLIALIGFSRLYLGVHYPKDVLVGIILGVLIVIYGSKLFEKATKKWLLFLSTLLVFIPIFFFNPSKDFYVTLGLVVGFMIGHYFEQKWVNFNSPKTKMKGLVRYVLGIALVLLVKEGLKILFINVFGPEIFVLDLVRYASIAFMIYGGAPYIYKKINI